MDSTLSFFECKLKHPKNTGSLIGKFLKNIVFCAYFIRIEKRKKPFFVEKTKYFTTTLYVPFYLPHMEYEGSIGFVM
jgi:hypothetical protein